MIYFTSDYHAGHKNILTLCNRPFANIEEMENAIIKNNNAVVTDDDTIYDLGDVAYRCSPQHVSEFLRRLNGKRIILFGNHDKSLRQAKKRGLLNDLINSGKIKFIGSDDPNEITGYRTTAYGQRLILSHGAYRSWYGAFRGAYHLYGHSHGNLKPYYKSFDVGVDANNFSPLSFTQIQEKMDVIESAFSES